MIIVNARVCMVRVSVHRKLTHTHEYIHTNQTLAHVRVFRRNGGEFTTAHAQERCMLLHVCMHAFMQQSAVVSTQHLCVDCVEYDVNLFRCVFVWVFGEPRVVNATAVLCCITVMF